MNVLVFYDEFSTYTNTVYDHLEAIRTLSGHRHAFCHGEGGAPRIAWDDFDALVIHYSLRVARGAISARLQHRIRAFQGLKVLFVQDEYDDTERTRRTIEQLGVHVVFTCVPDRFRAQIYAPERFPAVRFIETLTGYAPELGADAPALRPIAERSLVLGYRGRALPYWYGDLGQEKQTIAEVMKRECALRGVPCDIEWDDGHRIYGERWLQFLGACKATLGTESGANLFDFDGSLRRDFTAYLRAHPAASYQEARRAVLGDRQEVEIMNQVSPRIFESIACGTALVLFDGGYSGVVRPGEHYIALRKDFSNVDEVMAQLHDDALLQAMTARAYSDVIASGAYTYAAFVKQYDAVLAEERRAASGRERPIRYDTTVTPAAQRVASAKLPGWLGRGWHALPASWRRRIKPAARKAWDLIESGKRALRRA